MKIEKTFLVYITPFPPRSTQPAAWGAMRALDEWQIQRVERVAAVDKIEDQRKPEDFIGHRNRKSVFSWQ